MFDLELKWRPIFDDDDDFDQKAYFVVNGISDLNSISSGGNIPYHNAHFYNKEIISILTSYTFDEVSKFFHNFSYDTESDLWENSISIDIYCKKSDRERTPYIAVNLQFQDWEHWAKPWSMSSVAKQIEIVIKELSNSKIEYWQDEEDSMLNGFGVKYLPESSSLIIIEEVNKIIDYLEILISKTNQALLSSIESESVLTYFQFPDEKKTACKQYLVYFSQFISDMGILVDTELKEELDHTLFRIIPKDKNESLIKIREALNIYLRAPSQPDFQMQISEQSDIAIKQWKDNVSHLESQLLMVTSIIQAKDATIELLQLSNYQYRQMLETHSQKKENENEEVVKGIIAVNKYEGKGFSIDFAEIFRRLKRFGK